MTPRLMESLRQLHRAGAGGLGDLVIDNGPILVAHQLAERFTDTRRIVTTRYRLTTIGKLYADFFFEGVTK